MSIDLVDFEAQARTSVQKSGRLAQPLLPHKPHAA